MQDAMIAEGNWDSFLTLNGEELLLVKHQHKFVLFIPIFLTLFLSVIFTTSALVLYSRLLFSLVLFIASLLLIVSFTLTIISKIIVDWYYHFYVLTTRKILEVGYSPLSALMISDVLLDKVNCTEIDVRTQGILGELIDLGDIVITFDRPTHEEEFVLHNIQSCNKLGVFLTRKLLDRKAQQSGPVYWLKQPKPAEVS